MREIEPAVTGIAGAGDAPRYMSLPISYSQPASLAALASSHGVSSPDATTARVLELGCASGGNIIPLAARFPDASFLGIDLDAAHIVAGQGQIATLRLTNIELRQGDIATLRLPGRQFDYVICHGVFSWTPAPVREAIFSLCAAHLAENGVAAVSFNVLPGWRVQQIVRDLFVNYSNPAAAPLERVAHARLLLKAIADGTSETRPYGLAVRQAAARLSERPASYILGEFLASENTPFLFDDFAAAAARAGLSYLCDANILASSAAFMAPRSAATIRALAGNDALRIEGLLDAFSGRTFRRALLTRYRSAGATRLTNDTSSLDRLHVALAPGFDEQTARPPINNPDVARVFAALTRNYPASASPADIIRAEPDIADPNAALRRVWRALLEFAARDRADILTVARTTGRATSPRPRAFSVARAQALDGQRWVSSLAHRAVGIDADCAALLPLLDGSHDRAALLGLLPDGEPRDSSKADASRGTETTAPTNSGAERVDRVLQFAEREALLEA